MSVSRIGSADSRVTTLRHVVDIPDEAARRGVEERNSQSRLAAIQHDRAERHAFDLAASLAIHVTPADGAVVSAPTLVTHIARAAVGYDDVSDDPFSALLLDPTGPASNAHGADPVVHCSDTRSDPRWPYWCRRAVHAGVGSLIFAPLTAVAGTRVGVLVLYASQPRQFSSHDQVVCDVIRRQTGQWVAELQSSARSRSPEQKPGLNW